MSRLIVVSGSREHRFVAPSMLGVVGDTIMRQNTQSTDVIMHGDARGVDACAAAYAEMTHASVIPMPAQWDRFESPDRTNPAGPIRNSEMVQVARATWECGWDVVFLCFPRPGSRGTRNMIDLARRAGRVLPRERWSVHVHELEAGVVLSPQGLVDSFGVTKDGREYLARGRWTRGGLNH